MVAVAPANPRSVREPDPYVLPARVGAFVIDGIPIAVLGGILSRYFVVLRVSLPQPHRLAGNVTVDYGLQARSLLWGLGFSAIVFFLYFMLFEVGTGTTPGKALADLRIVDLWGQPASHRALLVRNLLRPIDALGTYWLGFLVAAFSRRRQRIGDQAAGTMVVSARSVADTAPPRPHRRRTALVALGLIGMLVGGAGALSYLIPPPLILNAAPSGSGTAGSGLSVVAPGARSIRGVAVPHQDWGPGKASYRLDFLVAAARPARVVPCHFTLYYTWTDPLAGWQYQGFEEACIGRPASDLPGHPGGPPIAH